MDKGKQLDSNTAEYTRITHDLHHNIYKFLDEVKGHVEVIEEEIKQLEAIDLNKQMELMIEEAYQKILLLKLGE